MYWFILWGLFVLHKETSPHNVSGEQGPHNISHDWTRLKLNLTKIYPNLKTLSPAAYSKMCCFFYGDFAFCGP